MLMHASMHVRDHATPCMQVARLPALESLDVTACWELSNAGLQALACPSTGAGAPTTTHNIISGAADRSQSGTAHAPAHIRTAAQSLRHLCISATGASDEGLVALARGLNGLVALEACRLSDVGERGVAALAALTALTRLKLNRGAGKHA